MKRLLFAISMVLVFGIPSASLAGGAKETGVVAHWSGTYTRHPNGVDVVPGVDCTSVTDVCSGDLVTCAVGEDLTVTLGVFYFLEGICDDSLAGPSPACVGRFTFRGEECFDPTIDADVHLDGSFTDGPLISVISRGVTMICFEDPATGSLACADGLDIGRGKTLTQTRFIQAGGRSPASATTETTEFTADSFEIAEGVDAKLRFKETVAQITLQRNPTDAECGTFADGGCGVAGTSVRSGTMR